uniref:RING-type domain-containing protein n=1 Tax=Craspedostauros australis TaxID=1486917 RepID=A0A7R9WUZ0_9STRA|mmetsp:Transcript_20741/g.57642  ORF Transcript_20741/g.57642 Transcript_20741/m.57642 type:complete len:321 (+) Transcript_20741:335-1297(+)
MPFLLRRKQKTEEPTLPIAATAHGLWIATFMRPAQSLNLSKVQTLALLETFRSLPSEDVLRVVIFDLLQHHAYGEEMQNEILDIVKFSLGVCSWQDIYALFTDVAGHALDNVRARPLELPSMFHVPKSRVLSDFKDCINAILSRSTKVSIVDLPRFHSLINACTSSKEEVIGVFLMRVLPGIATINESDRDVIIKDVTSNRFDLLLLPDRFDCGPFPHQKTGNGFLRKRSRIHTRLTALITRFMGEVSSIESPRGPEEPEATTQECPVCLEDFEPDQMKELSGCRHTLCSSCLQEMTDFHGRAFHCPLCRVRHSGSRVSA